MKLEIVRRLRRCTATAAVVFFVAYLIVSISPLRESVGRRFPRVAAIFSPPWFNFGATYRSGRVLDFQIGMSRHDHARVLSDRYASRAVLQGGCGDNTKFVIPDIRIDSVEGSAMLAQNTTWCLRDNADRLSIFFSINHDSLSQIRVAVVHSEM